MSDPAQTPPSPDPNAGWSNVQNPVQGGQYAPPGQYPPGQYPPPGYGAPPPGYTAQPPYPPASAEGLSDNVAGALAYVTIIPAIIFLVMAPYNTKPFVKFHAFQSIGLAVFGACLGMVGIIPILGWIVLLLGLLAMLVMWILCIVKAFQGSAFKLPVIGKFAADQSGYRI